MARPKRRSKPSRAEQSSEPAEVASRSKGGKNGVNLRTSTSAGAVKGTSKKTPRVPASDVKVRASASENQVSIDVGYHRPRKRPNGKRGKEVSKEECVRPPPRPDASPAPDNGGKATRRRKRAERGDGEKRSMSPEKPSSDQRNNLDAKQTPSPTKGSAETKTRETQGKPDPALKTKANVAPKNTDTPSTGGFLGFVQNIVNFLTPAPPRKRRPGPKGVRKRAPWQAGRHARLRVSEKNIEFLKREAEAARKRNADKECVEVRQLFSTLNGKDDDKIEVLHSRGMRKKSLQDVKDEANEKNKVRKPTATTRKKSQSKREDKGHNVTEFEKGDKEQVEGKVSTGKKRRNLNGGDNEISNNRKKPGVQKHGVGKTTRQNKNNCSEQTFETGKDKNRPSDEGVKHSHTKSVERSGHEHRGKQSASTGKDARLKSKDKQLQSKRSPESAAQTVKKTPSPTRDVDRNAAGQRQKSKVRGASDQALKSTEWESGQCKRHRASARNASKQTVKSTPAPVKGIPQKDPNVERKRRTSPRKDTGKQRFKSTDSASRKEREKVTTDAAKRHKQQAREASEHGAKSSPSLAKEKCKTGPNDEGKRPKTKAGDLFKHKLHSTRSPEKGVQGTDSVVEKRPKSKARDASEKAAKSTTLAKGVKEKDQNEPQKYPKSKVRDASEYKVKSTPSPSKATKGSDKFDNNKQSKTRVDSKTRESKTRPRPAGHTVSVEVVTSFPSRDKEESRKKRSQSSGQPNDKPLTDKVTETPSKLSRKRQKVEESKENMLASTTDDEADTLYERPHKPRWFHSKDRAGEDSKLPSKYGFSKKIPIQKTNQDRGEIKSLKSKKSVNSKLPCRNEAPGTSDKLDDSVKADYNQDDQEQQNVNKGKHLSPGENQEFPCHGTKLSTHILRDIRNEAKRLGVTLTPKVDKFLAELKQSLIYSHLAPTRSKSRHEDDNKITPKCSKTQKRSQSVAPETTSLRNALENESIDNHPKHVKCHSSACLKKQNRRKWDTVKETSPQKLKSPTAKSLTRPEENADGPSKGKNNEVGNGKNQSIQSNPLEGLGEELLNTLMNDRRLLDNLDALCEAIRTGQPYVGKSRSEDKKIGKETGTMEDEIHKENWGGDMKSTPKTTLAPELSGDDNSEKTPVIDCDICSIDILPFEKKFARYLDNSYLERSLANAEKKRKSAEKPNLMKKSNSDKEDPTPKVKNKRKLGSKKHANISSQRKHLGKKISCTSITDSYNRRNFRSKGLESAQLNDNTSENKGDWICRLTQPSSKHKDAKCEAKISRDKPYEYSKGVHSPPDCTTRVYSCLVPSTTEPSWKHEGDNNNDEREPVNQHTEETEDDRPNGKESSSSLINIKPDSRDSSSGSATTTVMRQDIYKKADEIYRRIMVQKRLHGPQPNVLYSTILNKLLQAESSRIMAEDEKCLTRSKRRRHKFETDTCTTVSVRSSSRDQGRDDECSALRQLCYDRTNLTEGASNQFPSKLKKKKRGKFRSKTLQLSQEDVSNFLNDDFEKGSKKKRRVRTEDVLLSQVTESEERTRNISSGDVNVDRDAKFCKYGKTENESRVNDLCIQIYRETEDSYLFERQKKTKHTSNKPTYICQSKRDIDDEYFTPSECSSYQNDVETDDVHLTLALAMRKKERQNEKLHKVEMADTLAMVPRQASSHSNVARQETMFINREASEDKVMQQKSKKRAYILKEPKCLATKYSGKVRVRKASIPTGKRVKAESKIKHQLLLENPPLMQQYNDFNYGFRCSEPAKESEISRTNNVVKELEISRSNNVPSTASRNLQTEISKHRQELITDNMASIKTITIPDACMDNTRNNYENGLRTRNKQESPPPVSDRKGTEKKTNTPKDRMQTKDTNTKKRMRQKVIANIKSVSPQKVAGYLLLNSQLNKERHESRSRQTSPCSKTSGKLNPDGQLQFQRKVPGQTKLVLTPRNPVLPQLQINKEQETLQTPARNNVQYQSNCQARMLNHNAAERIDLEKQISVSPRGSIAEISKCNRHKSPVMLLGTEPDTRKLTPIVTGKRARSSNPTKLHFPQLTKHGQSSLEKPIGVKNAVNTKGSGKSPFVTLEQPASEISIVPTKVVTLPEVAKTPKVTNIYTVKIDQQPSNCGLKPGNLSFASGQNKQLKPKRAPIIPMLQQRSKSDMNRTEIEKSTFRQRTNDKLLNEQYRTTIVPHKEVIASHWTRDTSPKAGEKKAPGATSTIKNKVQQDREPNTNNHEVFWMSPGPSSRVEPRVEVPRRAKGASNQQKNTSREIERNNLRGTSGCEDCMDEASGQDMNGSRHKRPRTAVPKDSIQCRNANKTSLPATSRLESLPYTSNRNKCFMAFENQDSIENIQPVGVGKTRSRRQCSVGYKTARVPSKIIKSRSFLDRPAFISVVRPPREDINIRKSAASKAPKGNVFASRMKIEPSQTRKVVDARAITAKIPGLHEMQCRKADIEDRSKTRGKVTCAGIKESYLDDKNGPHFSTNVDTHLSVHKAPTMSSSPWKEAAEAKQIWWEQHGDKFEKKLSKTSQEIKNGESSSVNHDISPRDQRTKYNGPPDSKQRDSLNDPHKVGLRHDAHQMNGTETFHQQDYHQHHCIEYVTDENKIHQYGCTQAIECIPCPVIKQTQEDFHHRKEHKTGKDKTMINVKQKMEPTEGKRCTWSERKHTLTRKPPGDNYCERESNDTMKVENSKNFGSVTNNSIYGYSRSRTWHGTPTNFVKRNIIASSQVKSIAERNRAAANKYVEKWKQHVDGSIPQSAAQVHDSTSALADTSIARRVEELEGRKRPNKEDIVTSRSLQNECEKEVDKRGDKVRVETKTGRTCDTNALNNTGKRMEVVQANNNGAVPKYSEDKANRREPFCLRKRRARSDSEGSLNITLDTCDFNYGCSAVQKQEDSNAKSKMFQVEHVSNYLPNKHTVEGFHKDPSHRRVANHDPRKEQFKHLKKQMDSKREKPKACDSEDESVLPNVDSGAFGRCREQTDSQGNKPKTCGSEDQSELLNVYSGAFGRCGREHRGIQKSERVYLSDGESESESGSNHSDVDCSDSGNSENSCCNRSIGNASSCCISVCTSNTSQEDSCKGEECTSDESACTAASEVSCYVVDEQSSVSQDYICSDAKSNDSPEQSNYSLEYQKGEIPQTINPNDERIRKVRSPTHVGDNINIGDLYGNHIETPVFKNTLSSNKTIGEKEEVTLITPSSENLLAHAVGSKKLSREQNSIKQFYKTVQIPHGPSPSSMRINHVPENCPKPPTFCKTTRGISPDKIPFTREHVTRMPTILSENNARAMKRDLEGSPVSRPGDPCRQRSRKSDCSKQEPSRGFNTAPDQPPPPPPPLPLPPPQSTNQKEKLAGKKSTPTQTDSRELERYAGRPASRMLHSKNENVFSIQNASKIVAPHTRETKSSIKDKDDLALRTGFKKITGKGGGLLESSTRPSEINDQREHNLNHSEGKSTTEKLSGESYLHCFYDDKSIHSKPQNICAKTLDQHAKKLGKNKRLTTNNSQNNNKSKQKYHKASKVSKHETEKVNELKKMFEQSGKHIEQQLGLMITDKDKKDAKFIRVSPNGQLIDRKITSNEERAERDQLSHTKHNENTSENRIKEGHPNELNRPSDQSLEDKNVNFIKEPSVVGDSGSSYSSSTCSFECCSDKHAGIPSNYMYQECATQKKSTKSKHGEGTVPIAKEENEGSIEDKIISCSRSYEINEGKIIDISSKTKETFSGHKPTADEYVNDSTIAHKKSDRHNENHSNIAAPSTSNAINMVYKNSLCKPIAPSEEVIAASCDKNTQLFQLLTRNLDGNGSGKNYLIINNCLKEIVVSVDESGFKLAAKSSGEEDRESQESERKKKSRLKKSEQTGDGLNENSNERTRNECSKPTMSGSIQQKSTDKTKPPTGDIQELPGNTSPRPVANSRSVQRTDRPFSQKSSTSRETQDIEGTSTSCGDQTNSGGRVKSSEFSSRESGGKSTEQTSTEDSKHTLTMRTKSCLDEPWSLAANVNSSSSRSAASRETSAPSAVSVTANKEWSVNESTSKSSSEKSEAAVCSSSASLSDVGNSEGLTKASKHLLENQAVVLKSVSNELNSTKNPISSKSSVKPEQSIVNEKPINNGKVVDTKKLTHDSKHSKSNVLPASTVNLKKKTRDRIKLESSSGEALTLESLSTMSFVDRSTPATSNRSSRCSIKEHIEAEDNDKQTTTSKGKLLVESRSVSRRQATSESRRTCAVEVQRTVKRDRSFTSSGSGRSVHTTGGSSHKDPTSTRSVRVTGGSSHKDPTSTRSVRVTGGSSHKDPTSTRSVRAATGGSSHKDPISTRSVRVTSESSHKDPISTRSVRVTSESSHKDATSTRHSSDQNEQVTTNKKSEAINKQQKQSQKHEKLPRKRRSKDVVNQVKERTKDEPKDMMNILYETDKRVFDDVKRSYTESVSHNEDDQMTDFEMALSDQSLPESSTKRKKKKKNNSKEKESPDVISKREHRKPQSSNKTSTNLSKEKESPDVVSRREHRKPQSSNKKNAKNDPASTVKKSDPRSHKLLSQVGRWIGKKIDKI